MTPVSPVPMPLTLASMRVGQAASSAHEFAKAANISFMRGWVKQPIVCAYPKHKFLTSGSVDFEVFFIKSAGCDVLRIGAILECEEGWTATAARATVTVPGMPLANGADWLDAGDFDGSEHSPPAENQPIQPEIVGWIDVSGVTNGAVCSIPVRFTWVAGSGSSGLGLRALWLHEVPNAFLDPEGSPTTEPGLSAAWTLPGNEIYDGSPITPRGKVRETSEIKGCRTDFPRSVQLISSKSTDKSLASITSTSYGSCHLVNGFDAPWHTRARAGVIGADHKHTLAVVYRNSSGSIDGKLRVLAAGSPVGSELLLPHTSGAWATAVSASGNIPLPVGGTDQLVKLQGEAKVLSGGPTIDIATIALLGAQD